MIHQHSLGVLELVIVNVFTNPEAALKVFNPQVYKLRVLRNALETLVLRLFIMARDKIRILIEVAESQVVRGMF